MGMSGNTAGDYGQPLLWGFPQNMLARFPANVLAYNPQIVIIQGGMNDTNFITSRVTIYTVWAPAIEAMCELALENHIIPVLGLVTPDAANTIRAEMNVWLQAYASDNGFALIDFYDALDDPNNPGYLNPIYQGISVHPNAAGYIAMANVAAPVVLPLIKAIPADEIEYVTVTTSTDESITVPIGWNV